MGEDVARARIARRAPTTTSAPGCSSRSRRSGSRSSGYGCTTCIGNSGPLPPEISEAINDGGLSVCAVLSGNRNFEGRIHPDCRMNYLASPPLVVAYALAGTMDRDLRNEPLGDGRDGHAGLPPRHLADVGGDRRGRRGGHRHRDVHGGATTHVLEGDERWRALCPRRPVSSSHGWRRSTYIRKPPFLEGVGSASRPPADVDGARVLALLGDSVTTDHISPAGVIRRDAPAAQWLLEHGVPVEEFNSYGARRGNHEVMVRGHVRQRPLAQPTRARHRRRRHGAPPRRRADDDLRRVGALCGRRRAARRARRQGVRLGQLTRLGGEGLAAARRPRGDRRIVRTDPPLEPRRHGCAAAAVRRPASRSRRSGSPVTRSTRSSGLAALAEDGPLPRTIRVSADGREFETIARIDTPFEREVFLAGGHPAVHLASPGRRR